MPQDQSSIAYQTPHQKPIGYRPEIDGLRALAVVAVIIYHAEFVWRGTYLLSGGFLGVDVFFVISGFLITSIILRELRASDSFSFARFYERRARRILPALFLVMLTSIPFAWALMSPSALYEYSGSGLSSLFFGSNIWFWQENSYTAEISQLKPFLHTWTLSVEEQFYVFFPILMILLWTFFRRWSLAILIVLGLASLQLAQVGSVRFANAAFYLLPTRGWELLAGSVLAFLKPVTLDSTDLKSKLMGLMPALGLAMVLLSFVAFQDSTPHPSYATVLPIAGTLLLIRYSGHNDWVTKMLSTPPFVGIGLISYSLYLWHFPVFAFSRLSSITLPEIIKLVLIGLSVGLAVLSYFYVEKPFRRKNVVSLVRFIQIIGSTFLVLIGTFAAIYTGYALPAKYAKSQDFVDFRYDYRPIFREGTCFLSPKDMSRESPFAECETQNASPDKPTIFLWGDSHAAHLFAGFDAVYSDSHNIVQRTASVCAPILKRHVESRPECLEINDAIFQEILDTKPDRLVLAAYWWRGSSELARETLEALRQNGISHIEIVGPVPRWEKALPVLVSEIVATGKRVPTYMSDGLKSDLFDVEAEWKLFASREDYIYQSSTGILCRNEACLIRVEPGPDGIVQYDTAHLTRLGSEYLVSRFEDE